MLLDIYSLFWDTFQSVFFAKRHMPYVYSKWFKNRSNINPGMRFKNIWGRNCRNV